MPPDRSQPAPDSPSGSRNLWVRVAAAAILIPVALGLAWSGGWWWLALVALVAVGLIVEWLMMIGVRDDRQLMAAGAASLVAVGFCLSLGQANVAAVMALAGALATLGLAREARYWAVLGYVYAAIALAASLLVRGDDVTGFRALIFVFLIVWVTDSLGYFVGRSVGGPKLWRRVSPNKTWAGALGGFFGSIAIGVGFSSAGYSAMIPALVLSALLSVVSQFGDLFESAVKRRFGVKDSGQIIPGHGGLLDRLDGYIAAIGVAALIGLWRGGFDGVGQGLMIW